MELNTNVPTIRFNGFDDQWSLVKLGKISSTFTDGDWIESKDQSSEGIRLVQTGNIGVNKFINKENTTKWISFETFNKLKCKEIFEGDILISRLPEPAGRSTILPRLKTKAITSVDCTIVRLKDEYTNTFINQFLSTNNYFKRVNNLLAGGTRQRISRSNLYHIDFFICSKIEQTQIGNFFKTLDSQINSQEQKHQKLINLKRAMLEKMFPKEGADLPEIRFKGFTEKWEEKKLGDVVEFYSGLTYSPKDVKDSKHTLVLRSSNVKNNNIVLNDNVYVDNNVINSSNVKKGDIIVVVRNGSRNLIGKHAEIKAEMPNTVIGAFMTGVRYNISNFLNAILDSNRFTIEIEKNLGATINQITNGSFKAMLFRFPSLEEQQKIGEYFEKLDNLIQKSQVQIGKYKNIKQALLQKMFV